MTSGRPTTIVPARAGTRPRAATPPLAHTQAGRRAAAPDAVPRHPAAGRDDGSPGISIDRTSTPFVLSAVEGRVVGAIARPGRVATPGPNPSRRTPRHPDRPA